jgi:hypothetical protein
MFFTELNLFADAGMAYDSTFPFIRESEEGWRLTPEAQPVYSVGISGRINLFGQIVLEPYYAIPISAGGWQAANFGLNFWPGW